MDLFQMYLIRFYVLLKYYTFSLNLFIFSFEIYQFDLKFRSRISHFYSMTDYIFVESSVSEMSLYYKRKQSMSNIPERAELPTLAQKQDLFLDLARRFMKI